MSERIRYQKLFMTTLIIHIVVSFLHASFTDDSAFAYICLFYCGFFVIGQYLIRTYIKSFLPHIVLHLLLIIPALVFFAFSSVDGIIMIGIALFSTMMSFRKSINNKNSSPTEDMVLPGTILLFPLFAVLGKYYGYTTFSKFVLIEAIIYCILFVSYTLFTNEAQYIRDHVATMNIPTSRIRKFTKIIRLIFTCIIIFVMVIVNSLNIALPKLKLQLNLHPNIGSTDTINRNPDNLNIPLLADEEPSVLAVFLGYVAIFIISILIIITILVIIIILIKELYGSIGKTARKKKEYIEEDEITIEAINPFIKKKTVARLPKDNAAKIRRLYHDYVLKKLGKSDRSLAKLILSSKTPKEINTFIIKEKPTTSATIQSLYEKTRYSNNYTPTDDDVTKMKTLTSHQN